MKLLLSKTIIIFTIFLSTSSCSFLKNENDHKQFVEIKLLSILHQKDIHQPNNISDIDISKSENRTFIDFINTKRTKNGTFVSKMDLFETYYNYTSCYLPSQIYWDGYRYVQPNTNGYKLVSILKRPLGSITIRTDFDGENIYLINVENFQTEVFSNDKKDNWDILFKVNGACK
jgi:hypothetical protein